MPTRVQIPNLFKSLGKTFSRPAIHQCPLEHFDAVFGGGSSLCRHIRATVSIFPDLSAKFSISNLERLTAAFSCLGRPRAFEHVTNRAVKFPDEIICAMAALRIQRPRTCHFVETVQDQRTGGRVANIPTACVGRSESA